MIFRRCLTPEPSSGSTRTAFEAIAEVQQAAQPGEWFITQPDHAGISGELAAALAPRYAAHVSESMVRAIALHDAGWMPVDGDFDSPQPPLELPSGQVRSFVNTDPATFLSAWTGSIQTSASAGPLAALVVSEHFARIAKSYLDAGRGTPQHQSMVEQFCQREHTRCERLRTQLTQPGDEVEALIQVLQFCDLASLYLCANPAGPVELPPLAGAGSITMHFADGAFRTTPALFARETVLEIPCVRFMDGVPEREVVSVRVG